MLSKYLKLKTFNDHRFETVKGRNVKIIFNLGLGMSKINPKFQFNSLNGSKYIIYKAKNDTQSDVKLN